MNRKTVWKVKWAICRQWAREELRKENEKDPDMYFEVKHVDRTPVSRVVILDDVVYF